MDTQHLISISQKVKFRYLDLYSPCSQLFAPLLTKKKRNPRIVTSIAKGAAARYNGTERGLR